MKTRNIYSALTLMALFAVLNVQAQQSQQEQLPAGASADWYANATSHIQKIGYNFYPATKAGHFHASNTGNHLGFDIQPGGYTVYNMKKDKNEKAWKADFTIFGIGRRSSAAAIDKNASAVNNGSSLTFPSGFADVQYVNDAKGLRQNFIVNERPAGEGSLYTTLQVNTALQGKNMDNNKLVFHTAGNAKDIKLIYDELKVWDATNRILEASMTFNKETSQVMITVNDANAVYPVTIDPLNRTPEWTAGADGVLPALLNSLQVQSLYGLTVAGLGDVNADGFDDVAVSAPSMADVFTGTGSLTGVGAVFIYFGSATGLPVNPSKTLQPTTAVTGALFGYSVAGGDVTGDGINDIIIGAPLDRVTVNFGGGGGILNGTVGKVYIYQGGLLTGTNPTPLLSVSLTAPLLTSATITINALFGFALDVADDMNGDSKGEIVVGAPTYAKISGLSAVKTGGAFVFLSNPTNTFTTVRSLEPPTGALLGLLDNVHDLVVPGIIPQLVWNTLIEPLLSPLLNGQIEGLLFGYSVDGTGDYNNDGSRDVVVGAPAGVNVDGLLLGLLSGQVLGGSAYVFNGANILPVGTINPVARLQAQSTGLLSNAANLFGYEVKGVTAVNGVRNGNILVGAPAGAVLNNLLTGLQVKAGQVHAFRKKTAAFTNPVSSDQVIASPRASSILSILALQTTNVSMLYGSSIDNMLDVNCDGFNDIIIGEPMSSSIPLLGANGAGGSAYILLGQANGLYNTTPFWDLTTTVSPLLGVNATSLIGYSVAGARYVRGRSQGVRSLIGGPSNTLDFGAGLLNLGNTLGVTFSFVFDNNGLGKAYSFPYITCNITLPASLLEFKGKAVVKTVQLNWTAVTEISLDRYELERSIDGQHYETIALAFGKGEQRNDYAHIDKHPYMGMNYYRLKLIDKDGRFTYSNIVAIPFTEVIAGDMVIAPNPVRNDINVKMEGMEKGVYRMELVNTSGQVVTTRSITISQFVQNETIQRNGAMASGIYWLNVYNNTNQKVKSLRVLLTTQ
ncbi:MAG TPA: T9SS type A sorting domain-containing protein [Chitinophagaceae bacterium]|jgi:hypothetical protein|nr:T9SS type A sorting domain-containing protein [Chitinophagaceae bacterium]